jgi:DNA-binding MarR family transcriptional regulator
VASSQSINAILKHLRVVFRTVQSHSRWVEKQCGVSAAQLWAMWELSSSPGLRVSDLSQLLSIHQSTASNMLDKLEDKEFIRRERGGPDQRVVRLFLTPAGSAVLERAPQPVQGVIFHALRQLPPAQLQELGQGLAHLINAMEGRDDEDGLRPMS